jgi:hypothetical protein
MTKTGIHSSSRTKSHKAGGPEDLRLETMMKGAKPDSLKTGKAGSVGVSRAGLEAMIAEAALDCYNDAEQLSGLFTMMEENLALPFKTIVLGTEVVLEKLDSTAAGEIVAVCRHGRGRQRISILDLTLPPKRPAGAEWIEAYRHWLKGEGGERVHR